MNLKKMLYSIVTLGKPRKKNLLAKAALKYLPIPSTQVASEQLHSTVGNVVILREKKNDDTSHPCWEACAFK